MSAIANPKDIKTVRTFLTTFKDQNCSLMTKYSEPIKKLAESLNSQLTTVLAALPTGDSQGCEWCTEGVLENLFNCLNGANAITIQLGLELNKIGQTTASPEAITSEISKRVTAGELILGTELPGKIEAAIKAKQDGGELVLKPMVDQLCSQAKITGIEEGKLAMKTEMEKSAAAEQIASKRKEGLTTAGLPLPPDELAAFLRGTDEEFEGAKKRFSEREELLAKDGISLASATDLRVNLWGSDGEFTKFSKLAKSIPALRSTADPLAAPATPPAEGAAPKRMLA